MLIHLTDAPPIPGGSALNMGLKTSRWGVRMSREDIGQRGQGGLIDGLWPFENRRTREVSASTLFSYLVGPGSWGKRQRRKVGDRVKKQSSEAAM